jgi:pilus assembly protein CpaE
MSTRLLLATEEAGWESRVRASYGDTLNGELRCWDMASDGVGDAAGMLRAIEDHGARVVALGPGLESDAALDAAAALDRARPDLCVLLVAEPTPDLYRKALRVGVRDIVDPAAELDEVRAAFDAAIETAERRVQQSDLETDTRRTIAVVSPKGGAGKTAVSSNLTIGLAAIAHGDVVVVDLDVQFGDVANALRLSPEGTIADAVRVGESLDITTLKAFLTPHPSGAFALCAPISPADADVVGAEDVVRILRLLADEFSYVVLDTGAGLDEHTLAAMEAATDIVLVCGTDVASARGVRKEIDAFDLLGFTTQRRHLVLNRADARVGLDAGDIEATVGMDISVAVPSSRSVPLSMNQGIPLLEGAQKSPVSRSLGELVNRFAEAPAGKDPAATTRSRWRKESR